MSCHLLGAMLLQVCVSEQASLKPSVPQTFAFFGNAVAVSGERAIVGERGHEISSPVAIESGIAHVFDLVGTAWTETATLIPGNVAQNHDGMGFGSAVDLEGDIAVIGAPHAFTPSQGSDRGVAYVFELGPSGWTETAILDPNDPASARTGASIALDGDTVAVGASSYGSGSIAGSVYVFVRVGGQWVRQAKLVSSDLSSGDEFGRSVALQGDRLVVGAPFADGGVASTGAAYVFERNGTTWTETAKLIASDPSFDSRFGTSVDLDQDTIVAGAPYLYTAGEPQTGAAYVFVPQGSAWVQQAKLLPHLYLPLANTGHWVDLDRDLLVVSAAFEIGTGGRFIVYSRSGSTWNEHLKIEASDSEPADFHGGCLALENTRLVVGAQNKDGPVLQNVGQAYVYEINLLAPGPSFYCTAKTSSDGCVPRIGHYGQPSMSTLFTGEPYMVMARDLQTGVPGLLAYSITGPASTPLFGGILCLQLPVKRTPFKNTASSGGQICTGNLEYDFNALIASGQDPALMAGVQVWMQYWMRDPGFVPPDNVGLTPGLTAIICP